MDGSHAIETEHILISPQRSFHRHKQVVSHWLLTLFPHFVFALLHEYDSMWRGKQRLRLSEKSLLLASLLYHISIVSLQWGKVPEYEPKRRWECRHRYRWTTRARRIEECTRREPGIIIFRGHIFFGSIVTLAFPILDNNGQPNFTYMIEFRSSECLLFPLGEEQRG